MSGASRICALLRGHAAYAWDESARKLVAALSIKDLRTVDAAEPAAGVYVAAEIPFAVESIPREVDCFGVDLLMLHPLDRARFPGFEEVEGAPWLWTNGRGALLLAFNLAGFVERFIDHGEERSVTRRDEHSRLAIQDSTLGRLGVLHRPLLNTYLYALLAIAKAHGTVAPATDPAEHVQPPILVLSHDCDQLRGNDWISQAIRLRRFLAPVARARPPEFRYLSLILENALHPRRYFFDDALAMVELERSFGFRSAFYFLNGRGGRLGARSGAPIIKDLARRLPADVEIGIHYNYGYTSDRSLMGEQVRELERLVARPVRSGRAHYLRLDPTRDFQLLEDLGICADESLGFSGLNAFRVGFAGAYLVKGTALSEIPMHFMDSNTSPDGGAHDVLPMCADVEQVGGVITMLFHPGAFDTPEAPELRGLYREYLAYFHARNYRCLLPTELAEVVRSACNT